MQLMENFLVNSVGIILFQNNGCEGKEDKNIQQIILEAPHGY